MAPRRVVGEGSFPFLPALSHLPEPRKFPGFLSPLRVPSHLRLMTEEPKRPVGDGRRKDDIASLVRDIHQDAVRKEEIRSTPMVRQRVRWPWYLALALAAVGNVYLWVGQPAWLVGERAAPMTPEREEGILRFQMYVQAQRIEAFRTQHGRLPQTLEETGEPFPGMSYRVTGPGSWELLGVSDRARLVLLSSQPIEEFLGNYQEALESR